MILNWVKKNRIDLERNNYVLKADAKTNYWFGLSQNKIEHYNTLTNGQFNIIIYGSEGSETDFYTIPFESISDALTSKNLYDFNRRKRWVGDIKNNILRLRVSDIRRDISLYYSAPITNDELITSKNDSLENDYAIENAKREVSVRLKQSKFRQDVLANFNSKCCLTGVTETNLLVASHIIPWANKIETRLNPSNGLCLMVMYDKLFDQGYFTLDDDLKIITITKNLSEEIKMWLDQIEGKQIFPPIKVSINKDALKYHRDNIFLS